MKISKKIAKKIWKIKNPKFDLRAKYPYPKPGNMHYISDEDLLAAIAKKK